MLNRIDTLDSENTDLKEQVASLEEEKDQFEESFDEKKRETTTLQKKLKDKEVRILACLYKILEELLHNPQL